MPHVIVKLWPGKSEKQKKLLADAIAGGPAPERGYIEELLSHMLEGRISPAACLIAP